MNQSQTEVGQTSLMSLISGASPLVVPSVFDALGALIAHDVGFGAVALGGYAVGTHTGLSEPLLSLTDMVTVTSQVRHSSALPIIVDAGAGWGEPLHVQHAVRMIERVGADAVHIEDQAFPKRASYHAGIEHVIAADDMLRKLDVALSARSSDDFLVIARTDSLATHGYDEAIKRAQSYADAGADLVMIFPRNDGEARSAPQDLAGIGLVYVNSLGHTRPAYDVQTLSRWGWKVIYDPSTVVFSAADAIRSGLQRLRNHGSPGSWDSMKATRSYVERVLGLEAAYALERQTVEFADAP